MARYVVLTNTGAKQMCNDKFSAKFVSTVFHSVAKCQHAFHPDDPDWETKIVDAAKKAQAELRA